MTDTLKEQLSACLDGQSGQAELDLLLKRVARDHELRQTLGRYALIGEALRGAGAVRASNSFADRVAAAIAAENAAPEAAAKRAQRLSPLVVSWLRPAAGLAVAAGVATVAVILLQSTTTTQTPMVAQAPVTAPAPDGSPDSYIVPANTVSNFVPATRLTNYVVAHSEYSSPLGRRTVLSGVLSEEDDAADGSAEAAAQDALPDQVQRMQSAPASEVPRP